jgi:hypothetical protein
MISVPPPETKEVESGNKTSFDLPRLSLLERVGRVLQAHPVNTCRTELADLLERLRYLGSGQFGLVYEERLRVPEKYESDDLEVAVKQVAVYREDQLSELINETVANVYANELVQFGISPNFTLIFAIFVCNPPQSVVCEATRYQLPPLITETTENKQVTKIRLKPPAPYLISVQELASGALYRLQIPPELVGNDELFSMFWMSIAAQVVVGGVVPLNVLLGLIHHDLQNENVFYKRTSKDVLLHYKLMNPLTEDVQDLYVRSFGMVFEVADFGKASFAPGAVPTGSALFREDISYFFKSFALQLLSLKKSETKVGQWVADAIDRITRRDPDYWDDRRNLAATTFNLFRPITLELFDMEHYFSKESHPSTLPVVGPFAVNQQSPTTMRSVSDAAVQIASKYQAAIEHYFKPLSKCQPSERAKL